MYTHKMTVHARSARVLGAYSTYFPPRGFTLLELLVSIAIFSVLSAMSYPLLTKSIEFYSIAKEKNDGLSDLQRALYLMEQDIMQANYHGIRDPYGSSDAGFTFASERLSFTRSGWQNPEQHARSNVQRVQYFIESDTLWRSFSTHPNAADSYSGHYKQELLKNVRAFQVEGISSEGGSMSEFSFSLSDGIYILDEQEWGTASETLTALRITIVSPKYGDIVRLFSLPYSRFKKVEAEDANNTG